MTRKVTARWALGAIHFSGLPLEDVSNRDNSDLEDQLQRVNLDDQTGRYYKYYSDYKQVVVSRLFEPMKANLLKKGFGLVGYQSPPTQTSSIRVSLTK